MKKLVFASANHHKSSEIKPILPKNIKQIKKFFNAALKGHIDYVDPAQTELNQLLKIIGKHFSWWRSIVAHLLCR